MRVFRLAKKRFCNDLSGRGAEIMGGRWNNKGTPLVYTSDSRALCTAEIAVRIPLGILPIDYWMIELDLPDSLKVFELKVKNLPMDWMSFPHSNSTQILGDKFVADQNFLIMRVPSAIVQGDSNYVLNPLHQDIKKVKIVKQVRFEFDERLFKK